MCFKHAICHETYHSDDIIVFIVKVNRYLWRSIYIVLMILHCIDNTDTSEEKFDSPYHQNGDISKYIKKKPTVIFTVITKIVITKAQ